MVNLIDCQQFCRKQQLLLQGRLNPKSKLAYQLKRHLKNCPGCDSCYKLRLRISELAENIDDFGKIDDSILNKIVKEIRYLTSD